MKASGQVHPLHDKSPHDYKTLVDVCFRSMYGHCNDLRLAPVGLSLPGHCRRVKPSVVGLDRLCCLPAGCIQNVQAAGPETTLHFPHLYLCASHLSCAQ